ncbi:MAG: hypothetical protein MZW92_17375 [Comamonadaceae bacterium]|nr:hypothetical protein [Comamonadaceae bacterium]
MLQARRACAASPTSTRSPRATSSSAAAALVIRADRLALRQRRGPRASRAATCASSRDGAVYAGPELQLRRAALRGLLPRARVRARRSSAPAAAPTASTSSAAAALAAPPTPTTPAARATDPTSRTGCSRRRPRAAGPRGQRGRRRRRGAALPRRADPGAAGAELPADRRRASRAGCRRRSNIDNRSGFELVGAVLLEHRAQPRRDDHAAADRRARGLGARQPSSATSSRATTAASTCDWLPDDRVAGRSRSALAAGGTRAALRQSALRYGADAARASRDDDWWKDFPTPARSARRRACCRCGCALERPFALGGVDGAGLRARAALAGAAGRPTR